MSLLSELRRVMPARRLTSTEAFVLAERQATALLRRQGITVPPVPSEVITELPFVTVARRTPMRSSGATRWLKPRWVILINGAEPAGHQRFSLAHEFSTYSTTRMSPVSTVRPAAAPASSTSSGSATTSPPVCGCPGLGSRRPLPAASRT